MLGQKNWLIILVKPHELELCFHAGGNLSTIAFPPGVVNNLEVLDRDALYALIAAWAKERPYQSTEIIWLLSPAAIFEQVFPDAEKERWDTMTVQFLDAVPFELILSRVYSPEGGRHVVATNQDLITALTQGFSMQGYLSRIVIPAKFAGVDSPLTAEAAKKVLNSLNLLLRENLIIAPEGSPNFASIAPGNQSDQPPKPKSSLPLLLGVFGILLAILVFVILLNQ